MSETIDQKDPGNDGDKLRSAWEQALDRLPDGESHLSDFTVTAGSSEVEQYLRDHPELSPEGRFFLTVSLEIKKRKGE